MLKLAMSCGIFVWPLAMLAAVIAVLSIRRIVGMFLRRDLSSSEPASGLDAILFWGAFSALLGIFAQVLSIYRAFDQAAGIVEHSPTSLAMGFADSLAPTVIGLINLMASALIWFALRSRAPRVSGAEPGP